MAGQRRTRGNSNNISQQVSDALEPIVETLTLLVKKYSGELVECLPCKGQGIVLHYKTGEPLPDANNVARVCTNCVGTGKRRV